MSDFRADTVSGRLVRFVRDAAAGGLPEEVRHEARRLFLNQLKASVAATDQAAVNRLQITIQVRFTNTKDDTKSFDQPFSFYKDFPQNQTLSQNESQLIPAILDQLVLDVFNKTAADW